MNLFVSAISTVALAFALAPATSDAQSLRCKSDLVSVGDARASVLVKCGEPVVKDSFCKPVDRATGATRGNPAVVPCENVDEWTYNPGYGQFMTTLRFEGGKVVAIKYGDRVTKQ